MYWYIQDLLPVCTGMYFSYLKLAFFENRHHHSISLAVELYAVTVCSRRAAGMYEKPSCLVFGTYQYIPVCTVNEFLYSHIPVHTGTYRYIRFCPILSRCTGFQMTILHCFPVLYWACSDILLSSSCTILHCFLVLCWACSPVLA